MTMMKPGNMSWPLVLRQSHEMGDGVASHGLRDTIRVRKLTKPGPASGCRWAAPSSHRELAMAAADPCFTQLAGLLEHREGASTSCVDEVLVMKLVYSAC
jgi:hypothetical protein